MLHRDRRTASVEQAHAHRAQVVAARRSALWLDRVLFHLLHGAPGRHELPELDRDGHERRRVDEAGRLHLLGAPGGV